ncbi:MAG TPA: hypothetical protein VFO59_06495 [Dehalococcoidia bacterium]|nr:hypothetical protein [Dehalococcoidia bacterium]
MWMAYIPTTISPIPAAAGAETCSPNMITAKNGTSAGPIPRDTG